MIEYIDKTHTYLHNGVQIPSISDFLHYLLPDKYKSIDKEVLNKKAEFGTKVHEAIEMFENLYKTTNTPVLEENISLVIDTKKLDIYQEQCLRQYLKLKYKYDIQVVEQEQIVTNGSIAGRLDMIAFVENENSLVDIKTTAQLDKEYLSWQLSLYSYLYNPQAKFSKLYCLWLPKKDLGQLVEIEYKPKKEIEKKLKEFLKIYNKDELNI